MSADVFATVGDDVSLREEISRVYWQQEECSLFEFGPSVGLISVGSVASNPWFVEPALREAYAAACVDLVSPLDVEDARRVSWSAVKGSGDGWNEFVLADGGALSPEAYRVHAALLLKVHGLGVEELIELRSRPCRSGWSFETDRDFQKLFSLSEGSK